MQSRRYNSYKCIKLVKAIYKYGIVYDDKTYTSVNVDFYYNDETLAYIIVNESSKKSDMNIKTIHTELFLSDLDKSIIPAFSFCENIRIWIKETNDEILKKCLEAFE